MDSFRFLCGRYFSSLKLIFSFGSFVSVLASGDLDRDLAAATAAAAADAAAEAAAAVGLNADQLEGSIWVKGDLTLVEAA